MPRSEAQVARFQALHLDNLVIPPRVLDGLNLVYYSDMVISAGGSMNREAVVLGTPAVTLFQGRMAGVDRKMIEKGVLKNIQSLEEMKQAIPCRKPQIPFQPIRNTAVDEIIQGILSENL